MDEIMMKKHSLWTALITPLNLDGSVDYLSLLGLLKEQDSADNGILILGSTGEALNLSEKVRKEIIDFTVDQKLNSSIMVGIGGINLEETLDWLKYLESKKLDCYLMVTPLYSKPGVKGQYHWFKTLLDQATRPCMLYNIPGRTGKMLEHKAVSQLVGHKNFWAIKEASGSPIEFQKYVEDGKGKIEVYSGDDALLPAFYPLGCSGLVSVASNPWPLETHLWVSKVLANKATLLEVCLWEKCTSALFMASNPIPVKVLQYLNKKIKFPNLLPPLTHEEIEDSKILTEAHQKIVAWYKDQK